MFKLNAREKMISYTSHKNSTNWSVLYTKSRAEKKVAKQLCSVGVDAFCPVRKEVRQWSDRKKIIYKPALPSMILVLENSYVDQQLFSCKGVVGFMSYKGKRALVTQNEVDVLSNFLQGKYTLNEDSIIIGDHIKVPVLQQQGRVVKIKGNDCWVQLANASMTVSFSLS